jgi:coenzyme PQQ synthesis protein D (PqqD)
VPPESRFRSNSPPVIQETIDGETIMVNLDTGSYYWLDPLASYVCGSLEDGASTEEVVDEVSRRFPAERHVVEREVQALADRLVEEALLVSANGAERAERAPREFPALTAFEAPVFKTYTDMQELLLLDPVHDVGVEGWPEPR